MLTLLKLLQSLFKTLHSQGTPGQVAAGMMLGAGLGLSPILAGHNLVLFTLLVLLNVSFAGGLLGMALFTPVAFIIDPLLDRLGLALLDAPRLQGFWTSLYNTPLVPYTSFNNSVTLGALALWLVLAVPIYFGAKVAITRYRATIGPKVENSRLMKAVKASKAYNVYTWFKPE
jgi:uncharacterized protein (TIGR03546 family)